MGILIAIDGVDASGKGTQSHLIHQRLNGAGILSRLVSFPDYASDSSALVRMYLGGEFGSKPEDVNAYAASTFFAADRFASYRRDWKRDYDNGTVIVADRYVTSNIIHQASKLPDSEKQKFTDWLCELEYGIYALPKPDITIFLDMPPEKAAELMSERANKITHEKNKAIHESSTDYLRSSDENASAISERLGWKRISCVKDGELRTIDDINDEIMSLVLPLAEHRYNFIR